MVAESGNFFLSFFFLAKNFEKDYLKRFRFISVSPQKIFFRQLEKFSRNLSREIFFRMGDFHRRYTVRMIDLNCTQFYHSGARFRLSTAVDNLVCNSFSFMSRSFNEMTVLT
jgi:hypothetical protein